MWEWSLDGSLDSERMCLTARHFGLQEENTSPNSRERPLISKTGWGTTERAREDAVFCEKGGYKSLLDVENVIGIYFIYVPIYVGTRTEEMYICPPKYKLSDHIIQS